MLSFDLSFRGPRSKSAGGGPDGKRASNTLRRVYGHRAVCLGEYLPMLMDPLQAQSLLKRLELAAEGDVPFHLFLRDLVIVPGTGAPFTFALPGVGDNIPPSPQTPTTPSRSDAGATNPSGAATTPTSPLPPQQQPSLRASLRPSAPPLMPQVVDAALSELVSRPNNRNNILCAGFYTKPGTGHVIQARQRQPNLAVQELRTNPHWARLLAVVGPEVVRHMLVDCAVFHPFDNAKTAYRVEGRRIREGLLVGRSGANHVQLSGHRLDDTAWEIRRAEREQRGRAGEEAVRRAAARKAKDERRALIDTQFTGRPLPSSILAERPISPPRAMSLELQDRAATGTEAGPPSAEVTSRSGGRLPSWVRRRLAKEKAAGGEMATDPPPPRPISPPPPLSEQFVIGSQPLDPTETVSPAPTEVYLEGPLRMDCDDSASLALTLPLPDRPPATLNAPANTRSLPSRASPILSKMNASFIGRKFFFYSAHFRRVGGLSALHPLNTTQATPEGISRLTATILGETIASRGRIPNRAPAWTSSVSAHQQAYYFPSKDKRQRPSLTLADSSPALLDKRLATFTSLLEVALANAPSVPYRLLLERHCPLPKGWITTKRRLVEARRRGDEWEANRIQAEQAGTPPPLTQPADVLQEAACAMEVDPSARPAPMERPASPPPASSQGFPPTRPSADRINALNQALTSPSQVARFLWHCLRRLFPGPLLGGPASQRALQAAIMVVLSRRRFEGVTVGECMSQGILTKEFRPVFLPHLSSPGSKLQPHQETWLKEAVTAWVGWLLDAVVVELVRCHFYVTESESHRQHLFYFRKPVFAALRNEALRVMEGRGVTEGGAAPSAVIQRVSMDELVRALGRRSWGAGRLRILPKRGGFRPIANMSAPVPIALPREEEASEPRANNGGKGSDKAPRSQVRVLRSHNRSLASTFEVLSLESSPRGSRPEALGLSVSDFQDMYIKLVPFYLRWRLAEKYYPDLKPFIVSADVSKAFDSLDQGAVIRTASACLEGPAQEYHVRPFKEVATGSTGQLRIPDRRWPSKAPPQTALSWAQEVTASQGGRSGAVFADMAGSSSVSKARVLSEIEQAVGATYLKIGGRWYRLVRGVPQGSIASSLFCCLALGEAETRFVVPQLSGRGRGAEKGDVAGKHSGGTGAGALTFVAQAITSPSKLPLPGATKGAGRSQTNSGGTGSKQHRLSQMDRAEPVAFPTGPVHLNGELPIEGGLEDDGFPHPLGTTDPLVFPGRRLRRRPGPELPLSTGVRLVDDFLYISSSREVAQRSFNSLVGGLPEYGCGLNVQKTKLNFKCAVTNPATGAIEVIGPKVVQVPSEESRIPEHRRRWFQEATEQAQGPGKVHQQRFVPYCGLLINASTLELQADYARYTGEALASTITVNASSNPGAALGGKLRLYLSHKCQALLLDPLFVSRDTALLNCYQSFLIAAMKLHVYLRQLPMGLTSSGLLLSLIRSSAQIFRTLAIGRLERARIAVGPAIPADLAANFRRLPPPEYHLKPASLRFLAVAAFRTVLEKKHAVYVQVLEGLDRDLSSKVNRALARRLRNIIAPARSEILFQCKF